MSKPREAKSKSSITMQFKFGKWNPFDINWVPIKILVSLSIILCISICEFFLLIVSLEKITVFFPGKFFFTSSNIFSTPKPL